MRLFFERLLLATWVVVLLLAAYRVLPAIITQCGQEEAVALCRIFTGSYLVTYLVLLLLGGILAYRARSLLKAACWASLSILFFYAAHRFSGSLLSDPRTFGYEWFIGGFYFWGAILSSLLVLWLVYGLRFSTLAWQSGVVVTCIFIAIAVFDGRGSLEHITPLIGGLSLGFSWQYLSYSHLFYMCAGWLAAGVIYGLAVTVMQWVKDGTLPEHIWVRSIVASLTFTLIGSLVLLSLPPALWLNQRDVREAKEFVESALPQLQAYYDEKKAYPPNLDESFRPDTTSPELLQYFDYYAQGFEGAYYFSRPEKFCFIFYNPGIHPGFHTLTSERGWKFFPFGTYALETQYAAMCDEKTDERYEQIVTGFLGVENNPLITLMEDVEKNKAFSRMPHSSIESQPLTDSIEELLEEDPSFQMGEDVMKETWDPYLPKEEPFPSDTKGLREMLENEALHHRR